MRRLPWLSFRWRGGGRTICNAEVEASRASDFINGYACLNEEWDKPGMYEKLRDTYLARERLYRLAAAYPWLAVEPSPPWPTP